MAQEIATSSLFADANLVAYYKLENTSDSKGVNTLTNNGSVAFNPAEFNNGADFGANNTTKSLNVASNLGVGIGATTVIFWTKNTTAPSSSTQILFNIRTTGGGTNFIDWYIDYVDTAGTKVINFHRNRPGVSVDQVSITTTLGTSIFHQLALVYDGTNLSGYLDGLIVAGPTAFSGVGSGGANNFFIGAADTTPNQPYSGIIDDFAVFTRALTSIEILSLFNSASNLTLLRA